MKSTELLFGCGGAGLSAAAVLRQEADETVHAVVVGAYPDDPSFPLISDQACGSQLVEMRGESCGWKV